MAEPGISLEGLQEALEQNARRIAALQPGGVRSKAVQYGTMALHRYAVSITHVWKYKGGGLRASHRMEVTDGEHGRIYIDPTAVNPRGQRPAEYGPYEHARGGEHAFYDRTLNEHGPTVVAEMQRMIEEGILGA